ncbi:GntR family transcriptional regulator [Salisediminibacterium halotolerans]|uniref:GntR family transcriptional regulator n=1 Tax=Salisediminibacterium halotolerans TaxID=517425 RepID=UPI000EB42584|nr:GntR family transcriptional regulator [Salisediminibacterium halotolerans]RLJ74164.1 GntR family transcriptional regulator [Actinophytocola xinjiangensis]RPE87743.1 GntR family transcriptional regulator [Salisediminibacterium halotolerans]TWG35001.1 GntR family transcriptional regulator [Salisediminibacterium halotolerans]GEL06712.1 GntR family transcriptional regulator [Salisediminibacterium halotolerans]
MIRSDQRPLYLQVIDKMKEDIDNGAYKAGERLPSEFQLSKQLGVSRATLREALRMLEDENVIVRRHGVGTFINTKPLFSSGIEELFSVTDMIRRGKKEPGTNFLSSSIQPATDDDQRRFLDEKMHELITIERVRTADGEPVVYCLDKVPAVHLPDYTSQDEQSMFVQLESTGTTIAYALTQIEPLGYHEKVSEILQCEPETALLVLKQMHYNEWDEPILYSINYFRADKFKFHVLRKRVY